LRERLEGRADLCSELRLLSDEEEEIGQLTEAAGSAAFVARLDEDSLEGVDLVFLCGEIERDRVTLVRLPRTAVAVLLSRGATVDDAPAAVGGVHAEALAGQQLALSPHPAAVALVLLLDALCDYRPVRASATVVVPVSVFGDRGIDELFEQTRGILAFSGAQRSKLFPAQIAFNLLPSTEDAHEVERAARQALGREVDLAVQLVQGGVFHGVTVSLRVELAGQSTAAEVRKRLGGARGIALARDPRKASPVAVAGEESLLVGEVRAAGEPGAYWIWATMDNLVRGGALNALDLAEAMLAAGRPS
jgi:aspartate-semialdehyde dehydrogenase